MLMSKLLFALLATSLVASGQLSKPDEIVPENARARGLTTLITELAPGKTKDDAPGPRDENLLAAKRRSSSGSDAGSDACWNTPTPTDDSPSATCGSRVTWLMSRSGGSKSRGDAKQLVGTEFPTKCGKCWRCEMIAWHNKAIDVKCSGCTCGERVEWLMKQSNGGMDEQAAQEFVAKEFPALNQCQACDGTEAPTAAPTPQPDPWGGLKACGNVHMAKNAQGRCVVAWQLSWHKQVGSVRPGAQYEISRERNSGWTGVATRTVSESASVGVGFDVAAPFCSSCEHVEGDVSVGVSVQMSASIESGRFATTGTGDKVICPQSDWVTTAAGKTIKVAGYDIFELSINYKETGMQPTGTVICMPYGANIPKKNRKRRTELPPRDAVWPTGPLSEGLC